MLAAFARTCIEAVIGWVLFTLLIFAAAAAATGYTTAVYEYNARTGISRLPQQSAAIAQQLGLSDNPLIQYSQWITNMAAGEWGRSSFYRRPVTSLLGERVAATGELLLVALIASTIGLIIARVRSDQLIVRTLPASIPPFWLMMLLILILAVENALLPMAGRAPPILSGEFPPLYERLAYLVIPGVVLIQYMQARFLLVLRGQPAQLQTYANAFADELPGLFVVLVLVESIAAWPGLGRFFLEAVLASDVPVAAGSLVVLATLIVPLGVLARFIALIPTPTKTPQDTIDQKQDTSATEINSSTSGWLSTDRPAERLVEGVLRKQRALVIVLVIVVVFAAFGYLLIDLINLNPYSTGVDRTFLSLGSTSNGHMYLLGTDDFGRDFGARLIAGAQVSLFIAAGAALVSVVSGFVLARVIPTPLIRSMGYVFAYMPLFLLIILIVGLLGGAAPLDLIVLLAILAVIPAAVRLHRRSWDKLLSVFGFIMAQMLVAEATLSYLGLGIQPPRASLGNLLTSAQAYFLNGPHLIVLPGLMLSVLVFVLLVFSYGPLTHTSATKR